MKKLIGLIGFVCLLAACQNEEPVFEQSADERVAEAVANLKAKLIAPTDGWLLRYQPESESGTYNVLLNFDEDNNVRIRTDFGASDGDFYDQNVTYRIDNSLGLELILENYSFFSFLFEQNSASFLAEYEFDYVNETPDGALVFRSKTDPSSPTTLVFQPATANAESFLGRELNTNLELMSENLGVVLPVYQLGFANRDLSLYLSLNTFLRTISFTYASSSSSQEALFINFTTGYRAEGTSIILDEPLQGMYFSIEVNIPAIELSELLDAGTIELCDQPIAILQYQGNIAESGEAVALLPVITEPGGMNFENLSGIFANGVGGIYDNGVSVGQQIFDNTGGATQFVIYHVNNAQQSLFAMGYFIPLPNDNFTIPVKEFVPTYDGNQITFDFASEYSFTNGDTTATLNTVALDTYITNLTEGGRTRIIQVRERLYEFYNPCTGWSVVLQELN